EPRSGPHGFEPSDVNGAGGGGPGAPGPGVDVGHRRPARHFGAGHGPGTRTAMPSSTRAMVGRFVEDRRPAPATVQGRARTGPTAGAARRAGHGPGTNRSRSVRYDRHGVVRPRNGPSQARGPNSGSAEPPVRSDVAGDATKGRVPHRRHQRADRPGSTPRWSRGTRPRGAPVPTLGECG